MRAIRIKCAAETRLGRYELLEELGRGAMGIVYKARDPEIDRLVAIKTICNLAEDFEVEDTYRTRFVVEARAAGRLSHRGIVQVFDFSEDELTRTPYIVMEYVPGMSLSKMLAGDAKLPTESALRLAQEVAEALAYAHAQGVVHRDIKPSNIIVNDEGHAKITDLGVSKLDFGNGTVGGQLVGTPAYMAPEQLKDSSHADGRSDLFSVGVLLYCMLSGHRPFQGNSSNTVAFKINHHDPVPVTVFNPGLPAAINYVLARAMAKTPAQRYQTGTEMALDLEDIRDGKKPRSWTDLPATDGLNQPGNAPEEHYFQRLFDIATTSPVGGAQVASIKELSAPHRMPATVVSTMTRNLRVWLVVAITLGLAHLGIRALFAPAPPIASATAELRTVAAAVPNHNATSTPGPAAASTRSRPADSAAAVASTPEVTANKLPSAPETQKLAASIVELVIQHQFDQARISVWVDDRLAYTGSLRGEMNKRLLVFRRVRGKESRTVRLTAGEHRLRVRIQCPGDGYDQEGSILGVFEKNVARTLRVKCEKGSKNLQLRLT